MLIFVVYSWPDKQACFSLITDLTPLLVRSVPKADINAPGNLKNIVKTLC